MTNAIIMGSAFGLDEAFSVDKIEHNIWNSTVNMFARSPMDDWIKSKKPTIKDDGSIVLEKGQWSLRKWTLVRSISSIVYAFGKNVHLLGIGSSWSNYAYYAMGAAGLMRLIYEERYDIKDKFDRLKAAIRGTQIHICESLIIKN